MDVNSVSSSLTLFAVHSALSDMVDFDGYYLESDPCLVCNNPEMPFNVSRSTAAVSFQIDLYSIYGLYTNVGKSIWIAEMNAMHCHAFYRDLCEGPKDVF